MTSVRLIYNCITIIDALLHKHPFYVAADKGGAIFNFFIM